MIGTVVNRSNQSMFLRGVSKAMQKVCNTYVGVIDEITGLACGVLGAQTTEFNGLDICYIYVANKFRGHGAGTELVDFFVKTARDNGFDHITCTHVKNEESRGAYEILEKAGFVEIEDLTSPVYCMHVASITVDKMKSKCEIIPLGKAMTMTWMNLVAKKQELAKNDLTGSEVELSERSFYDNRLSFLAVDKAGKCQGALLVSEFGDDYKVECLYSSGSHAAAIILNLIAAAREEALRSCPRTVMVYVSVDSERARKIITRLATKKPMKSGYCVFQVKSL